jgi:glycosyltransferase involved in cell wall biosynthesis
MGEYLIENEAGLCLSNNCADEVCEALWLGNSWRNSGQIAALKENAYEMVKQSFNWEVIGRQMVEVYEA